jgi:hypothetical protein
MSATELIAKIRRNQQERDFCLAVLNMWAQVQEQGIVIDTVSSFGFDSRILTQSENKLFHARMNEYIETGRSGAKRPLVYTHVTLKDGSKTKLTPMISAVYEEPIV